jgi:hypothetical protein
MTSAVPTGEPRSVLEAVEMLDAAGFDGEFTVVNGGLACTACGTEHTVDTAEVVAVYRFEGPSDPDEEAVVYALRCPVCGAGGTLVSSFGPGADPEIADRLVMLETRFREHPGA